MDKKEVQEKIIPSQENKVTEEEFSAILKVVAPGTNLRTSLDGALKAHKGALVVIENESVPSLIDGGFKLNTKFTPQKLVELTKMDGAIVLSKDIKKITYANVLLTPESKISTQETGTRHKAAERTAKQASTLVIAISERKHEITLFYKNRKHPLINTDELLRKANEHIQLLEKQRELFDSNIEKLNILELRNYPSLNQAIQVVQKGYLIQKIAEELKRYTIELGKEGMLLKIRLKELVKDVEEETDYIIKDYTQFNFKRSKNLIEDLQYDEILDNDHILEILGYDKSTPTISVIKGWRILSKTSLHESEIAQVINEAGSLGKSLHSNIDFYRKILGEEKAYLLKEELSRIKLNNIVG
ncbi:MAG: DNA integrity scanning diadenylate cyclase DisA [Nanoarchaeota archaeon]|nr:DNA integrity scanning diadenylate cyclase DisA [Nanoarchaeota archaeon]